MIVDKIYYVMVKKQGMLLCFKINKEEKIKIGEG